MHDTTVGAKGRETALRFPNRISYVREVMRLKVSELARIVGVSRGHLTKVEAGLKVPSASIVHDIAIALDVQIEDLYDKDWSAERRKSVEVTAASALAR